jgi:hypothetical protein
MRMLQVHGMVLKSKGRLGLPTPPTEWSNSVRPASPHVSLFRPAAAACVFSGWVALGPAQPLPNRRPAIRSSGPWGSRRSSYPCPGVVVLPLSGAHLFSVVPSSRCHRGQTSTPPLEPTPSQNTDAVPEFVWTFPWPYNTRLPCPCPSQQHCPSHVDRAAERASSPTCPTSLSIPHRPRRSVSPFGPWLGSLRIPAMSFRRGAMASPSRSARTRGGRTRGCRFWPRGCNT